MSERLRILLVGGPMYDPLYGRLAEKSTEVRVEPVVVPSHPELNERIAEEFGSGTASYDLISTHAKYAPSQRQWLTLLDGDLITSELARIEGELYGIPRNLDVKLLYYRTDLLPGPPTSWEELREVAARLRSGDLYGFVFPGKESGLFGHFFELHAMHGGRMFEDEGSPAPKINDEAGHWALGLLEETQKAALAPPKHENYPAVEDVIWQGLREALLGNRSVEQALEETEKAARRAAEER